MTGGDGRRPRDLALLLLAIGFDPPRARARDQQADRAGGELHRRVLDRLAALDPEPEGLEAALAAIVEEIGEPSGPARGLCVLVLDEFRQAASSPDYWPWLIAEAVATSSGEAPPRKRKSRGAP